MDVPKVLMESAITVALLTKPSKELKPLLLRRGVSECNELTERSVITVAAFA